MRRVRQIMIGLWLLIAPVVTAAHEIRPALLSIAEQPGGELELRWSQPAIGAYGLALKPSIGSTGWLDGPPDAIEPADGALVRSWRIAPPHAPLTEQTVRVDGLAGTITDVLVEVQYADGRHETQVLSPSHPSLTLAARTTAPQLSAYFGLGLQHIWSGIDHLLYVAGLMLLVRGMAARVRTLTAFTVAHSLTLGASALGWIVPPSAPVEAVIALSILFVAVEAEQLRRGRSGLAARRPWLVAGSFGLLHGFGFAGALAQIGLPQDRLLGALLLFNVGIEVGQLLFVAALMAIALACQALRPAPSDTRFAALPPLAIGALAACWFYQRAWALF